MSWQGLPPDQAASDGSSPLASPTGQPSATATPVHVTDTPSDFSALHQPGCAAVVTRRKLDAGVQSWLNALAPERLPATRCSLRPDGVRRATEAACRAAQTPETAECAAFLDDIDSQAAQFAALMDAPWLRLRLDVITANACRKFHIDAVRARLICTYRGTGTQYGIAPAGGDPDEIHTTPTGAPLVLRGTLWPTDPPARLLHRSPPIEGTGETRLLLVLDPIFDGDEAP